MSVCTCVCVYMYMCVFSSGCRAPVPHSDPASGLHSFPRIIPFCVGADRGSGHLSLESWIFWKGAGCRGTETPTLSARARSSCVCGSTPLASGLRVEGRPGRAPAPSCPSDQALTPAGEAGGLAGGLRLVLRAEQNAPRGGNREKVLQGSCSDKFTLLWIKG